MISDYSYVTLVDRLLFFLVAFVIQHYFFENMNPEIKSQIKEQDNITLLKPCKHLDFQVWVF